MSSVLCLTLAVLFTFLFPGFIFLFSLNRKKLKSTSKYIYQTLFLNGENSDIRICALGQEWNLHKVYLCQVKQTHTPRHLQNSDLSHFFTWLIIILHFSVGVFLQYVQWLLEGVQHDGNQPGDP